MPHSLKYRYFALVAANPGFHPDDYEESDQRWTREQHATIRAAWRQLPERALYCYPVIKWALTRPGRPIPFHAFGRRAQ